MIDAPGRSAPRFPPRMEKNAARAIRERVLDAQRRSGGSLAGFASGARGGDILFHEICRSEGVPVWLVLPFEAAVFIKSSVGGVRSGAWVRRFKTLWDELAPAQRVVLNLAGAPDPFGACNGAMLDMARAQADAVELLALWDGAASALPGGTADFVERVKAAGGRVHHIDSKKWLGKEKTRPS
jgi:hypothetical protein